MLKTIVALPGFINYEVPAETWSELRYGLEGSGEENDGEDHREATAGRGNAGQGTLRADAIRLIGVKEGLPGSPNQKAFFSSAVLGQKCSQASSAMTRSLAMADTAQSTCGTDTGMFCRQCRFCCGSSRDNR
jgi:hypothetical protein